ncbi:hypothetical protein CUR178_05040 [Leishmania enriettii]|uniref:Uncharacterized protein n=1 Tax=Leishmania enriettii TaxID=5663 RepID=A0A836KPT1_LEIEN|nr:hypothetical protein CUR178_05040 [Leishmania enriettii]
MSGARQLYTATAHELPLPPKRIPPRQSSLAHLPISRAEVSRQNVRANSPARIVKPHGGEVSVAPAAVQRASEVVHGSKAAPPLPKDLKKPILPYSQYFSKLRSNGLVAPRTSQPPPESEGLELDDRSSLLSPNLSSVSGTNARTPTASEYPAEGGYATPPKSNATPTVPEVGSSSDSSPFLHRGNGFVAATAAKDDDEYESVVLAPTIERLSSMTTAVSATHSAATQSIVWRYSNSKEPGMHYRDLRRQSESTHCNPLKHELQQSRPRGASATKAAAHQEIPASSDAVSSKRGGRPSHDYSASERSSYRWDRQSVRSAALPSPGAAIDLDLPQPCTQQKMEEPRALQLLMGPGNASHEPLAPSNQPMTVVAISTTPQCSTNTARSSEDPLEMNTPIAERARIISMPTPCGARLTFDHAGALGGTELLPGLPRLQGRRNHNDAGRSHRTMTCFIAHQPEGERPGLEEMLANCAGRENELCSALGEAYSIDFEIMKAGCNRGTMIPLLKDRPPVDKRATAS